MNSMALAAAVVKQPVSISVKATEKWQSYKSGVIDRKWCGDHLCHSVAIVGY